MPASGVAAPTSEPNRPSDHRTSLAWLLTLLAIALGGNSLLGPLATEQIEYHYSESLINQGIGLDAVALLGAVPVALVAAVLVRRQHRAGPILAFLPATFAAYMAPQYVIGPDYLGLPGNNERFFVFHLGLFLVATATVIVAWGAVDRSVLAPNDERSDRRRSWVLLGVVMFIVAGRWLTGLIDLIGGDPANPDYRENPTAYVLIGFLDLGIIVPTALVATIGLRRHLGWARPAAYLVIGWFALVPAAVAAMAIVMTVNDDPNASTATTVMFVVAAAVFTVGAASLYRPLFRTVVGRQILGRPHEVPPGGATAPSSVGVRAR